MKSLILRRLRLFAAFRPLSKIFTGPAGRCGIFGIIGVLGDGKYALCGIGETVPELVFGHPETDKLVDVWNDNPGAERYPERASWGSEGDLRRLSDEENVPGVMRGHELLPVQRSFCPPLVL